MLSYNECLKREILRRDAALARLSCSVGAVAAAAQSKVEGTAKAIRGLICEEIAHAGDVVTAQVDHARDAYSRELQHTQTTFGAAIDDLGQRLNLANTVRAHPWGTTLGVFLGAALVAPLAGRLFLVAAPAAAPLGTVHETSAAHRGTPHARRKSVKDVLLDSLSTLTTALLQHLTQADKAGP